MRDEKLMLFPWLEKNWNSVQTTWFYSCLAVLFLFSATVFSNTFASRIINGGFWALLYLMNVWFYNVINNPLVKRLGYWEGRLAENKKNTIETNEYLKKFANMPYKEQKEIMKEWRE